MRRWCVLAATVLGLWAALAAPFGCGGSSTGPGDDGNPDEEPAWPDGAIALPPLDAAALDSAAMRYAELRQAGDAQAARLALLAELNANWPRVDAAWLNDDSSTVQVRFVDGAPALLITDEVFDAAPPKIAPRAAAASAGRSVGQRAAAAPGSAAPGAPARVPRIGAGGGDGMTARTSCGSIEFPPTLRIHVVAPSNATNDAMQPLTQEIEAELVALGWDAADIDISLPAGPVDPSFTPESILDQRGYGIVVFIGNGGYVKDAAGVRHFMLQCFRGGNYTDGYQTYVTPARWAEYEDWLAAGRLINSEYYNFVTGEYQPQVFIRGDLLAEKIQVDEGAIVHFIAQVSRHDEVVQGIDAAGAGTVGGWSSLVNPWDVRQALVQLIANLMGEEGARSDADAVALLRDQGLAETVYLGYDSYFGGSEKANVYLPAVASVSAPFDCLPPGTLYYDVSITFDDCPAYDQTFDFFPGGELVLPPLPPYGGEISLKARDAASTTLAAGYYDLELGGGPTELALCPCAAAITLTVLAGCTPPGATHAFCDFVYEDPTIVPVHELRWLADMSFTELVPGIASLRVEAAGGGQALGVYAADSLELHCEGGTTAIGFGWLKLVPIEVPVGTARIDISAAGAGATPDPISIPPTGSTPWYGFQTFDRPLLTALAYDGAGDLLSAHLIESFVDCGENEVLIDFDTAGVILTADPEQAHVGWENVTLTATVREWTTYDTTEPTGDPLVGVTVFFSADLGHFVGANDAMTNGDGQAIVQMASDEAGIATVIAQFGSAADTVRVGFVGPMNYLVDRRSTPHQGGTPPYPNGWLQKYCTVMQVHWNGMLRWNWSNLSHAYSYFSDSGPAVGDMLRFTLTPDLGCPDAENQPPFNQPWTDAIWLHYWYGDDYDHQITVQVAPAQIPLLDEQVVDIILDDPLVKWWRAPCGTRSPRPAASNQKLSESRAKAVVAAGVAQGIEAKRLSAIGYGQTKPIADNSSQASRAKNRRVELVR